MSSEASPDNTKEDKEKQVPVEAVSTNNETTEKAQDSSFDQTDFMAKESIGKVMWKLTYPSLIAKVVSAMYAVSSRGMAYNTRKSISCQITAEINFRPFSTIFHHFRPFSTIFT